MLDREVRLPKREDETLRNLEPAVEIERADQRLDDIPDDVVALARPVLAGLLPQPHERRNAELATVFGAGLAVDQRVVPLRQIAFGFAWISRVKRVGDDHSKYAVTEELEPFIAGGADAGMGQCKLEQREVPGLVPKLVANEGVNLGGHSACPL
jgi:hypothetical protein